MRILVTGATGFLGSAVVERLLSEGYDVVGTGRKPKGFLSEATIVHPRFSLARLDLTDDAALETLKPVDAILHLASQLPTSKNVSFTDLLGSNVQATYKVLRLAKQMNVQKFIYPSTGSIFSRKPEGDLVSEQSCPCPASHYGLTKYMGERLVEIELRGSSVKGIVVRYPSIFGKNHLGGIVCTFYTLARQNLPIEVYSKGERYRNLLYVDDAVEILLRLLSFNQPDSFEIFCAGSQDSQTMLAIATMVRDMLRSKSEIIPVDKFPPSDWDVFIDISKIQQKLGIKPLTVEKGLQRYIKDMGYEI
jgi:nucleoside-diphosphate-sugar epimerase